MNILISLCLGLHVLICFLLVVVVLMQRPKSEGLGAAFGGGMTENIFGARTTDVLQKFTSYLAGGFFFLTVLLAYLYAKQSVGGTSIQNKLLSIPAVTTPAVTTPAAAPATAPDASPAAAPAESPALPAVVPAASPAASPAPTEAAPAKPDAK